MKPSKKKLDLNQTWTYRLHTICYALNIGFSSYSIYKTGDKKKAMVELFFSLSQPLAYLQGNPLLIKASDYISFAYSASINPMWAVIRLFTYRIANSAFEYVQEKIPDSMTDNQYVKEVVAVANIAKNEGINYGLNKFEIKFNTLKAITGPQSDKQAIGGEAISQAAKLLDNKQKADLNKLGNNRNAEKNTIFGTIETYFNKEGWRIYKFDKNKGNTFGGHFTTAQEAKNWVERGGMVECKVGKGGSWFKDSTGKIIYKDWISLKPTKQATQEPMPMPMPAVPPQQVVKQSQPAIQPQQGGPKVSAQQETQVGSNMHFRYGLFFGNSSKKSNDNEESVNSRQVNQAVTNFDPANQNPENREPNFPDVNTELAKPEPIKQVEANQVKIGKEEEDVNPYHPLNQGSLIQIGLEQVNPVHINQNPVNPGSTHIVLVNHEPANREGKKVKVSVEGSFAELKKTIENYSLLADKVKNGVFFGKLPKNLREINTMLDRIKKNECVAKDGAKEIIKLAQLMGNQHPILNAAKKFRSALENTPSCNGKVSSSYSRFG